LIPFDLKIKPKQYLAFSKNILFLKQNYPAHGNLYEAKQMPGFNNDKGTVVLLNSDTIEFDRFQYTEKMHHSLLFNPEGVSLERASFEHSNSLWFSASYDVGYATPGSKNSQTTNDDLRDVFFAEPVVFNPFLSGDLAITRLKYNLTAPGVSVNIVILDKNGKKVKTLANNMLLGTSGEIEWDGKGGGGEILPVGYYVFQISTYSTYTNKIFLAKCVLGSY